MRNAAHKNKSDELAPVFALATVGIGIIPLRESSKEPLQDTWPARATTDVDAISAMRERWPQCNFGAVLGEQYLTVDFDTPEAEAKLTAASVVLPRTRTHRTARGTHRFFRVPEDVMVRARGGIVPGVDIKHGNAYVVVPPSIHPSGASYVVEDDAPIADAPASLIALCNGGAAMNRPTRSRDAANRLKEGDGRNSLFTALAGSMRRVGFSEEAILSALKVENPHRCAELLGERELCSIAQSIAKKTPSVSAEVTRTDEWSAPIQLGVSLPPVLSFKPDMLPYAIRSACVDVAERLQIPLDFCAVIAAFTLGASTGRRAMIQPKVEDSAYTEVPNLWGFIVAPPSALKSPAISALTAPLRQIEVNLSNEHAAAVADAFMAKRRNAAMESAWKQQATKAAKNKERLPEYPQLENIEPVRKRLITTDATPEALHALVAENPAGIAVITDELSTTLSGFEREGRQQGRSLFLSGWSGHAGHTLDTIGRGSVCAERVVLSGFGSIQPARLQPYLAETLRDGPKNDGFAQRYQLVVWPDPSTDWKYIDRKPNYDAMQRMSNACVRLSRLSAESPLVLRFDAAAQRRYVEWLTTLMERLNNGTLSPVMEAHLSKYRKLVPALALLFALADGTANDGEVASVPLASLELAIRWAEVLESHAERMYSVKLSAARLAADALARKLCGGWRRDEACFSLREVYFNGWTALSEPDEARAAVGVLVEFGWLRREPYMGTGRPPERFQINPVIYEMEGKTSEGFEGGHRQTDADISVTEECEISQNEPKTLPSKPSKPFGKRKPKFTRDGHNTTEAA